MDTNHISARNMRSLIIVLVLCGGMLNGAFTLMQDNWIAVLMMAVLFLPLILMFCRIAKLLPGKGLFEIIDALFPPFISKPVILLMTFYVVMVGALVLEHYADFTVVISLQETPTIAIMIMLILVSYYLANKGPKLLGRWSFIICVYLIVHLLLTMVFSGNLMQVDHLFPILDHSLGDISHNAFAIGCITIGETIVVLCYFGHLKKGEKPARIYVPAMLLGVFLFLMITIRNLLVLGAALENAAQFPTYMTARIIRIGNFLERIESSISIVYLLLGITKLSAFLTAASMGTAHLFNSGDYKRFLVPSAMLLMSIGSIVYKNVFEMFDFIWVYSILCVPFQVLLPLAMWITAEIKTRRAAI